MLRSLAQMFALVLAVVAVLVAVRVTSPPPDSWIVFDELEIDAQDRLVGWFRIANDPRTINQVSKQRIMSGEQVVAGSPWVLDGFVTGVIRRVLYEVRPERVPMTRKRELNLVAKERRVDCALLRHRANGQQIRLTAFEKIAQRDDPARIVFPDPIAQEHVIGLPQKLVLPFVEERDPPEPIRHSSGSGPLASIEPRVYTDSDYFEFADGRLVFWDALNLRVVVRRSR